MLPIRDDQRPARAPIVTLLLISACVAVFFRERSLDVEAFSARFGLIPREQATQFERVRADFPHLEFRDVWDLVVPYLTSLFLHQDLMHLVGNLWFLWVFGPAVESRFGSFVFVLFYLVCGGAAGAMHTWLTVGSENELIVRDGWGRLMEIKTDMIPTIGASGAIAGVLGAYFVLFPRARVVTFFPPLFLFVLPAVVFLGLWFVAQYLAARAAAAGVSGVAYGAHIGGFIAGMLLAVTAMVVRPREFVR